jgi:hypothetical protein
MKLFLLNTIENQEPSKIALVFLAFSVVSSGFLKFIRKENGKLLTVLGQN